MASLRAFWSRLRATLSPIRSDPEFDREIEAHIELLTERFLASGMTPEEAVQAARRQFGGPAQLKQQRHDTRGLPALEAFLRDVRQAVRMLTQSPSFTVAALLALTLGIGANTAVFSVVNAVLLKPLAAPQPDRLVRLVNVTSYGSVSTVGYPQFNLWSQESTVFEELANHRMDVVNLTGGAQPEQIPLARVSEGFFRLFGATILHGRTFTPEEDRPGGSHVVVLSHELWQRRFSADPRAVGRTVMLGSAAYTVVGVLAPGFDSEQFPERPQAWAPSQIDPVAAERGSFTTVTGRLKPGVSLATANAELKRISEENVGMLTTKAPASIYTVEPLQQAMGIDVRPSLLLLTGAVAFVLLIACANVANLLLIRATGRKQEIAIRAALGAGRGRIVRQLLTESVVLSLAGGVLGLLAGMAGIRAALAFYPGTLPRIGEQGIALDWHVVVFTAAVALLTGILFGLMPALEASRMDLTAALKESTARAGGSLRQNKARGLLVIAEVGLAALLLVGASLLIRSYLALHAVDPGFDARGVLTTQMSLAQTRFEKTAEMQRLVEEGTERIRALPGVEQAGAACCIPLETVWQLTFEVQGRPLNGKPMHGVAGWTFVSPGYFDTFRIPILQGRGFTADDRAGAPGAVVINETLARSVFPGENPIGQTLILGRLIRPEYQADPPRRIVGIVGDVRDKALSDAARPAMYVPFAQLPDAVNEMNLRLLPVAWFVRTRGAPPALSSQALPSQIRRELEQASGGLPVSPLRSMQQVESRSTASRSFSTWLMTIFGSLALVLAAIGIYGLMGHWVTQRTREIGIRMALGADRRQVRFLVVTQGLALAGIGAALGLAAAFGASRMLARFLFGVDPHDPVVFAVVPALLGAVAFLAVYLPARRATHIDPVKVLRCD